MEGEHSIQEESDWIEPKQPSPEAKEVETHQPLDWVMVFGIGPVQPANMVGHESKGHKYQLVPEAKLNAIAAATLYLEGKTRKIIFSGGETGKMDLGSGVEPHPYPRSEGKMMARFVIEKFGIPEEDVVVEDQAANTIENISRSLTAIDANPDQMEGAYLGSAHHSARIEKMVRLFGLQGPTISSAAVIDESRARAEAGAPSDERVHRNLAHYRRYLEKTLDPDTNPTYKKRLVEEERWSAGLDKNPSYFLPQLRFIQSDERLLNILRAENLSSYLAQKGIDFENLPPDKLREELGKIEREVPDESFAVMPDKLPTWRYEDIYPPLTEQEKKSKETEVYDRMRRFSLTPAQLIQGGRVIDIWLEEAGAAPERPFMVFLAAHPTLRNVIFKAQVESRDLMEMDSEIKFLSEVAPRVTARMSTELASHFKFPRLYDYLGEEDPYPCMSEECFDGEVIGTIHQVKEGSLEEQDVVGLAELIKLIQEEAKVGNSEGEILESDYPVMLATEKYATVMKTRGPDLRIILGAETFERIERLLFERQQFLASGERYLAGGDINPSNIIRNADGSLGMFDWERTCITDQKAYDYDFMFADLWSEPELQKAYFQKIMELNQDDPDFLEKFRLDFIFQRGTGELRHWWKQSNDPDATEEDKATAIRAIAAYKIQLHNALNYEGLWEKTISEYSSRSGE